MAGYTSNPLFTRASRRLRESARQTFRRSEFGRLLREFETAYQKPAAGPRDLGKLIHALERHGPRELLRQLGRSDAGRLARDLDRYARRGRLGRKLVDQVLSALGPAGGLIKALSGVVSGAAAKSSSRQRSLEAAIGLIQSFGGEVLHKPGTETPEQIARGIEAARKYLESHGQPVPVPGVPEKADTLSPRPGRKTVDVPMSTGITRRFALSHPIVTGEMVPCNSSNVHSFGYDVSSWLLYVRFLAPSREGKSHDPGPIYQYSHVPPEVFLAFLRAGSKGNFVWDRLRIRGTVSGHRFDYRLVGIAQDYVPRKATLTPRGEEFLGRTIRTDKGRGLSSSLPDQLVRPLTFVGSNGTPNRGRPKPPNRGTPNRGRP